MAHALQSQPHPEGYGKPTEQLTNGKLQTFTFKPKTYGHVCEGGVCHGSHMIRHDEALAGADLSPDRCWEEAQDYIREYHFENKLSEDECLARLEQVKKDIYTKGYYEHTYDELSFGVKTCWRNARRCIMRSQWNTMTTIDARHVTKAEDMFDALEHHLDATRNGGRIRPHVTIFPQKKPGQTGARIWNEQLLRYAAYKMEDGTIIGDPVNLDITQRAIELGWTPKYGMWDTLPIILNEDGGKAVFRDIPPHLAKQVHIEHPTYEWFKDLGLRWFDHPPVSAFALSIGGIEYCCAPFSGWFMSTEIASRDLADEYRYNALPEIARRMGLPMNNRALWKDRAVIELNTAVLHSWDKAKTTLVDHHSASDSFVTHYEKEIKNRGHCPADWVWITPPTSGGQTKVFHQEMYSYLCKPAVLSLNEKPWETYWRLNSIEPVPKLSPHETFKAASANAIVIAYGTETGTAQRYAEKLRKHLLNRKLEVDPELVELDNLKLEEITNTVVIITSSFGDGEPPSNALEFNNMLNEGSAKLNARFAVFGLGSRLYSDTYQHFPRFVDKKLAELGGRRIITVGSCDETADPEPAFESWITSLGVAIEVGSETTAGAIDEDPIAEAKETIRGFSSFESLAVTGGRAFYDNKAVKGDELRAAYNIELTSTNGQRLQYIEGDHISVLPPTQPEQLKGLEHFIAQWGDHTIENVSVARILKEFIDWAPYKAEVLPKDTLLAAEIDASNLETAVLALPLKKVRNFSIASTPLFHPATLHIAVAKVEDGQTSVPMIESVRTRALQLVSAHVRPSKFRLPEKISTPIILVGAGTGAGPLRAMMHNRLNAPTKGETRGSVTCILGFRDPEQFFYPDEFNDAASRGVEVWPAFSRHLRNEYVGDVIVRESNKLVHLLENGANFYICGSTALGKSAEAALGKAVEKTLGVDDKGSKAYIAKMRKEGRLQIDTYTRVNTH
jgi:nitric oxide synthase oxygenase domain/subunit/sulfite reductase alpha subunit-like flavoprotein